jgi:membrane protease YdiL (CAAX protease family)
MAHLDSIRSSLASLVEARPATAFFTLTLAVSWTVWGGASLALSSVPTVAVLVGGFGPAVAGLATVRLRGESVRSWLAAVLDWHVPARRYLLALGLPLALSVAIGAVLVAATGRFDASALTRTAPMYPVMLAFTMLVGGGQEEFGWRGFALPALQERVDALTASVVVGVVWAVWHLPLFVLDAVSYADQSFVVYLLLVVGFSVVFTWLYNSTSGSVLPAVVLHGGINGVTQLPTVAVGPQAAADLPVMAVFVGVVWLLALALLARYGRETLTDGPATTLSAVTGMATSDGPPAPERADVADD